MGSNRLTLVPSCGRPTGDLPPLAVCGGCQSRMRPNGTTEAEFPGTVPAWGDHQCRSCDYLSAGKDPEDRFIPVERVDYLLGLRKDFEESRKRRSIPVDGLHLRNRRHLEAV